MKHARVLARDGLHVFVLVGFAVAQPLFAVLSEGAAFFVARGSEPVDILLLTAILCFGFPMAIVFVEFLIGLVNRTARRVVHFVIVATLLTIFALPVLKKLDSIPGIACVIGAAALGLVAATAYYRFNPVRTFVTVLAPAILVFPALFLFQGPVSEIVWGPSGAVQSSTSSGNVTISNPSPIVFVVLDEFPTVSLMNEDRQIDPVRYPNFAAFAEEATWFRNMTTNSPITIHAVPAMLTGKYPTRPGCFTLATAKNHPNTLFTLLRRTHNVYAFERYTDLCPFALNRFLHPLHERMRLLGSDLCVVYCHIMLPHDLVGDGVPEISAKWADFRNPQNSEDHASDFNLQKDISDFKQRFTEGDDGGRVGAFRKIIARLRPMSRPPLYYVHVELPHFPFIYLPSGARYANRDGWRHAEQKKKRTGMWVDDEPKVAREYQRHLLQVGCTDTVVGELMDHLKQVGLYDDALIVLVSDHGVCHRPNEFRRMVRRENLGEMMPVPLLIKAPHQKVGTISDRNVESIDILPTIAGILGMDLPFPFDGSNALDPLAPERPQKVIYQTNLAMDPETRVGDGRIFVDAAFPQKYEALERKLKLFGSGKNPNGIYQLEPYDRLVARPRAATAIR